ncbi:unnamed protein product [Rotaria socialis]|uniref:ADP ribosyltransferase domain-containing protein n=2 Tax=Rotaria socialis TaxID=392032 RepID=A0A818L6E3_9BILA|nr:unnamed protein product [Rotaria socialis]CAF3433340.1 unnamed protein product [Rotaria socialis]CAF3561661.1 unnamed protein product [Rotaria socialis]CAF3597063.1 unnamed protein product [Rotaria socialis]CAF4217033.1 unnamed protein product [Rotaria socialis]
MVLHGDRNVFGTSSNTPTADLTAANKFRCLSPLKRFTNLTTKMSHHHDANIFWLDTKLDPDDERTKLLLLQLNDHVELFNDIYLCLSRLYTYHEMTLFIVSGTCAVQCLQSIHSLSKIDSILIFCASPEKYAYLISDEYPKVLACVNTEEELVRRVHSWIDAKYQTDCYIWRNDDKSGKQLSRLTALFLANYILTKYVEFELCDESKQEMLELCRTHYSRNQLELKNIKEFELTYTASDAIGWYTRDSFVHKMVNRALRSFDEIKLRCMTFLIRDIRQQLKYCYQNLQPTSNLTVYRGMSMSMKDIQRMRDTPLGSLILMNGFLSTTRTLNIALAYASKNCDLVNDSRGHVLFEINIDVVNSPAIYADVSSISTFQHEDEILFDMGTLFQIESIDHDEDSKLWKVQLITAAREACKSVETLLSSIWEGFEKQIDGCVAIATIRRLLSYDQPQEPLKKQYETGSVFSWLRFSSYSTLLQQDGRRKNYIKDYTTRILKHITSRVQNNRTSAHHRQLTGTNGLNPCNTSPDETDICNSLEPILFFHLETGLMRNYRNALSTKFSLHHRRFITNDITTDEVETILDEFHSLFYIGSEFLSCVKDNSRIHLYSIDVSPKAQDNVDSMEKSIEKLTRRLRHDLAIFYRKEAERFLNEQDDRNTAKKLFAKSTKCYELIANETQEKLKQLVLKNKS